MATARRLVSSTHSPDTIDAIALLKADHAEVSALFSQYEKGKRANRADRKTKLAEQICDALTIHVKIEEEIFYPACEGAVDDADNLLAEALVEHTSVKELIDKIESGEAGSDEYDAQVKVLGEYVTHHVKEEHTELFPKVRASELDLKALGGRLAVRKRELQARK